MTNFKEKGIPLPVQKDGKQHDVNSSRKFATAQGASAFFEQVKQRLMAVNNWGKISGAARSSFCLTDADGNRVSGPPEIGYYIKIDVPGPGSKTGNGFDWVKVKEGKDMELDREYLVMRVRPASNPVSNRTGIAHFFSNCATSNFLVMREKQVVTAAVLGRNELPNTNQSTGFLDKLRNAVIGIGAALGMSHPQWKSLVSGLLNENKNG